LLQPDLKYDYNAYVYDEKCLIECRSLFKVWFDELEQIRKEFPKNTLVKFLMSSLWGQLTAFNNIYVDEDNINEYDATYRDDEEETEYKIIEHTNNNKYKIIDTNNPYKRSLARIKPFLTANCRLMVLKIIEKCNLEDNVIRFNTVGIVLNKPFVFDNIGIKYYPKPEDKSTGFINWHNAQIGFHACKKCNEEFKYKDFLNHTC